MNQSSFGLINVLNGISKTLNVANQVIPIYKQVSPMVKNVSNAISNVSKSNFFKKNMIVNNKQNDKPTQKKELSLNNPVFFH